MNIPTKCPCCKGELDKETHEEEDCPGIEFCDLFCKKCHFYFYYDWDVMYGRMFHYGMLLHNRWYVTYESWLEESKLSDKCLVRKIKGISKVDNTIIFEPKIKDINLNISLKRFFDLRKDKNFEDFIANYEILN